jgi:MFS family permease
MLGDASYEVAFAWLVLSRTGSAGVLGAVLVVTAIPRGLLLPIGGAITDRFSPRLLMAAAHLVRGIAVAALSAVAAAGMLAIWHLFAAALVFGVAEAFFWPATGSIMPSLVEVAALPRANALTGVAEQVSRLAGPMLGGALVTWRGTTAALVFNAVTFFIAATTVLAAPKRATSASGPFSVAAIVGEISSGLSHARRSAPVRAVLLLLAAATLSYSGLFAVGLPILARQSPHSAVVLGVLLSAWGLGQLVGAGCAAVTELPRRWGLLIIGMTLTEGISFATIGLLPDYRLTAVLLTLLGVGVAYSTDVALPTFVQTTTPPGLLGRVNSILELPRVALAPVSIALMGALASAGARWAFVLAALPMVLAGLRLATDPATRRLTTAVPSS